MSDPKKPNPQTQKSSGAMPPSRKRRRRGKKGGGSQGPKPSHSLRVS